MAEHGTLHPLRPAAAADHSTLAVVMDRNLGADLAAADGHQGDASDEMEDGRWLLLKRASTGCRGSFPSLPGPARTRASLQRDPVSSD